MVPDAVKAFQLLHGFIITATDFKASYGEGKVLYKRLVDTIKPLSLVHLNYILYRCETEEGDVYYIPGYGPLKYCGLQGK